MRIVLRARIRRELADVVRELDLPVVEDRIWSFLHDGLDPLAAYAPERVHVVDGLSKRVAPGLTVGFLVVPQERVEAVAAALLSGGWTAGRFALEAGTRWIADGTGERLVVEKRAETARRQEIVHRIFAADQIRCDPAAAHCASLVQSPPHGVQHASGRGS